MTELTLPKMQHLTDVNCKFCGAATKSVEQTVYGQKDSTTLKNESRQYECGLSLTWFGSLGYLWHCPSDEEENKRRQVMEDIRALHTSPVINSLVLLARDVVIWIDSCKYITDESQEFRGKAESWLKDLDIKLPNWRTMTLGLARK